MPRIIECFLIEPTNRYRVSLRRYAFGRNHKCPSPAGYHNADVYVGTEEHANQPTCDADGAGTFPHEDPRWPKTCSLCNVYVFAETDEWQVNYETVWVGPDGKEYTTLDENQMSSDTATRAPAGAMWRAPWMESAYKGPDGHCYVLRTPGGDWPIDNGWTRTGGPAPKFTARPSILCGKNADGAWRYHGFLTDGRLEEC